MLVSIHLGLHPLFLLVLVLCQPSPVESSRDFAIRFVVKDLNLKYTHRFYNMFSIAATASPCLTPWPIILQNKLSF